MNKNYVDLNSMWVTGFSDGEASFYVSISYNNTYKTKYRIIPNFSIELKDTDLDLLFKIKSFFKGAGRIHFIEKKGHAVYVVSKIEDLQNIIIPHFTNYPLLTVKRTTFLLFKDIVDLMYNKKHYYLEYLNIILNNKSLMNKNIIEEKSILLHQKNILSQINPLTINNLNPYWLAGFTDAEGCFFLNIRLNKVTPVLSITQHSRDIFLFNLIKEFLGGGFLIKEKNKNVIRYRSEKLPFIVDTIIPLFNIYQLQSRKIKDYFDFSLACKLLSEKSHFTTEGLLKIKNLKSNMNSNRK